MQPKPFLNRIKMRNQAYGKERRRNLTKIILEDGTPMPKGVVYKDIDNSVLDWVKDTLKISFDGTELPTFKLFSNQRINEYAQTWNHLDENGNIMMNFKTVTRENNPSKGENQGRIMNIPGNRDYPMFIVPKLHENGLQYFDMYSMKQPFCVDLTYSISIITSKYELLNEMNMKVNFEFKAIDAYICPNGHFMPMTLETVEDDSEYSIDDRKYYSQTYKVKVKAYIIQESDFKVTHLPSRATVKLNGVTDKKKHKITVENYDYSPYDDCPKEVKERYKGKGVTLTVNYPSMCSKRAEFTIDTDFKIETIETHNVYDFILFVNGELQKLDNELMMYNDDEIVIEAERDNYEEPMSIIFKGYNPNEIIDTEYNPESSLDEITTKEEIEFNA